MNQVLLSKFPNGWSEWDKIVIDEGDLTLEEFLRYIKDNYNLEVYIVSCHVSMIYANFMARTRLETRLKQRITEIITQIGKHPLPDDHDYVILEIAANTPGKDDEDISMPGIHYFFRPRTVNAAQKVLT